MDSINVCSKCSRDFEPGAYNVTNAIKKDTTPDQFNKIIEAIPNYKLEYGGRCGFNALGDASMKGNPELIRHIVQIGGKHLLNLGNMFGWTPLYCAAYCEDKEGGFLAAKELIRLGADLNLATADNPCKATPLWAAAEKTQNLKLVKLLLLRGAIVSPNPSEKGQEIINAVQGEIKQEIKLKREVKILILAACLKPENNESFINGLPRDLVRVIFEYSFYDPEFSIN